MNIFDCGRYKCLHDLLLKKILLFHAIAHILSAARRLNILNNATYINISVNTAVELTLS